MSTNPDFAGLLIHRVCVFRRQEQAADAEQIPEELDPFGQQQKRDPFGQPTRDEQFHHAMPGRYSRSSGNEVMAERSRDVVQEHGRLFLDAGADLREDDVVTVKDPAGTELVTLGQVNFIQIAEDGVGEHHRMASISSQRQSR